MADWASLLRSLGLGTGPLPPSPPWDPPTTDEGPVVPPSTMRMPLGMGQADVGLSVQQLIQRVLNNQHMFNQATKDMPEAKHPAGVPEGLLEQIIKRASESTGTLVPGDRPYLEQYLHPDVDILPKTDLRPTRGGPPAPMTHRLPASRERALLEQSADMRAKSGTAAPEPDFVASIGGLGNATLSQGDGYTSLYDKWDFDSPSAMLNGGTLPEPLRQALDWIIKQGMQRVGEPFAVYDRAPITRK